MTDTKTVRVAVRGRPAFFCLISIAALLLTAISDPCGAAGVPGEYRLAGIVAVGEEFVGFLELPSEAQVLVRVGSSVEGGGQVVELSRNHILIRFSDKLLELSLEGSGSVRSLPASLVVTNQEDGEAVLVREVDAQTLKSSLAVKTARTGSGGGSRSERSASARLSQRLNPVLNLPENARITAVNGTRVSSVDGALAIINATLAEDSVVALNLESVGSDEELTRVYITRRDLEAPRGE